MSATCEKEFTITIEGGVTFSVIAVTSDNGSVTEGLPYSAPVAVLVGVSPTDNDGNNSGTTSTSFKYNPGTPVTLTAPEAFGNYGITVWMLGSTVLASGQVLNYTVNEGDVLQIIYGIPQIPYDPLHRPYLYTNVYPGDNTGPTINFGPKWFLTNPATGDWTDGGFNHILGTPGPFGYVLITNLDNWKTVGYPPGVFNPFGPYIAGEFFGGTPALVVWGGIE